MPSPQQKPDYVTWNEIYSVGHEMLDRHHQYLLGLINELYHGLQAAKTDVPISSVAGKMYEYTREHFSAEESLMVLGNYPGLEEHKKLHAEMVLKTLKITDGFHAYSEAEALEVLNFLKTWWQGHITHTDRKYVPWLPKAN